MAIPGIPTGQHSDLVTALEESRYWVAIVAIDYQLLRTEKRTRPLWSIRYSMRSRGTTFDTALPQMTRVAAHFFGRDSDGLVPRGTSDSEGTIEYGELKTIEEPGEK
jgi:hypothetical protein